MSTISLAVTSYNQLDLLKIGLASVEQQTRPFDEVIVVDDCSTDGSQAFLEAWASEGPNRIFLKNPVNAGRSVTRNRGMDAARMEYLAVLDGDDWFEPNAVEEILAAIERARTDMVFFGYNSFDHARGVVVPKTHGSAFYTQAPLACALPRTDEEIKDLFRMLPTAWMKVYKRAFLQNQNLRSTGLLYEDIVWTLKCIALADSMSCIQNTLINYRMHAGSFLHLCSDTHFCIFDVSDECEDFLSEHPGISTSIKQASRRFRFNISTNALLNTNRLPETSKPRYAKEILARGELTAFDLDVREQEVLEAVKAVASRG